jgi:hypothetical protein
MQNRQPIRFENPVQGTREVGKAGSCCERFARRDDPASGSEQIRDNPFRQDNFIKETL